MIPIPIRCTRCWSVRVARYKQVGRLDRGRLDRTASAGAKIHWRRISGVRRATHKLLTLKWRSEEGGGPAGGCPIGLTRLARAATATASRRRRRRRRVGDDDDRDLSGRRRRRLLRPQS